MNPITPFINEAGTVFLAQDEELMSRLQRSGFQAGASLFNEYLGDDATQAFVLSKNSFEKSEITTDATKARRLAGKSGWKLIDSFNVSLENDDDIRKIKQAIDPITKETFYVTGDVARDLKTSGYKIDGKAWFAPANDGETDILKTTYDPVTGKASIAYKIDPLFLQQFAGFENQLSIRVTAVHNDGSFSSESFESNINVNDATKRSTFTVDAQDILPDNSDASDIDKLYISLNTKFGNDPDSPDSFGLVRSTSLQLNPKNGRLKTSDNTGGTKDINALNFFMYQTDGSTSDLKQNRSSFAQDDDINPQPGMTYADVSIEGRTLTNVDWSNVLFIHGQIASNNLNLSNFSGLRAQTRLVMDGESGAMIPYFTTWGYRGARPNTITNTNLTNAYFELAEPKWNEEVDFIGDLTGSYGQYGLKMYWPYGFDGEASAIVITNTSGKPTYVDGSSAQMTYGKPPSERFFVPKDFQLQISGYARYSSSADMDQVTNITVNGVNYRFSTDNPAVAAASLYLNGSEVSDSGSSDDGVMTWTYGEVRDMKTWFININ